ncbi:hypothetical protein IWZ00DRAFT_279518 [Phyllosticta capitalensis]
MLPIFALSIFALHVSAAPTYPLSRQIQVILRRGGSASRLARSNQDQEDGSSATAVMMVSVSLLHRRKYTRQELKKGKDLTSNRGRRFLDFSAQASPE